jgi:Bacterial Ig-like domain
MSGQVVVSGPLRDALVSVEQLDLHTGEAYRGIGDATTDQEGRFSVDTGLANGLLRISARGGWFMDDATQAPIQLDPSDEITSLVWFELVENRDDILVSPIGHLIDARTRVKLDTLGDMTEAWKDASSHLGRHFGDVEDWSRLRMIGLDHPATSPTEEVRAALVHVALSFLVRDIAAEAGSSPQEVNVFRLTHQWASDLDPSREPADPVDDHPVFDGNDGNDRRPGSGLQLGVCAPVEPTCQVPTGACNTGHCRRTCDLYVGTARSLLAGVMTKVIRDNGPGGANQTGLRIEDTLAIARSVSDNVDPDLFGGACIETLDRTAPEVRWDEARSIPANAVVRGVIQMKAVAMDDVDPRPRVQILGYADMDGDPSNDVALVSVDTTGAADGPLTVTARAADLAGNSKTIERRVVVDNTPPQLALSPAGFFVDGATWWTTNLAPTLTGTVVDDHPASVVATIGATQVMGTLSGGTWSVTLPSGEIDLAGANVAIRVTDEAGNHTELTQRIRHDATPPELIVQKSTVNNEAEEVPTFATIDESPIHNHSGTQIDLAVSGACPTVTKYSYLLRSASPPYVTETPARNPIAYKLVSADDGVGIIDGATQYRVLRRDAGGSAVVRDWTSAGAGTPIATGARLFDVAIVSDLVTGLNTTEGIYDVELRTTDRLSRTSTDSRCFELRLKAPPLRFFNVYGGVAANHTFALDTLSLAPGAPYDLIAARLLNANATGASLLDQWIFNGTTETVYLTVTVTKPTSVTASVMFQIRNFTSKHPVHIKCSSEDDDPACAVVRSFPPPSQGYVSPLITPPAATTLKFPVKLYEINGAGAPSTELPCLAPCDASGSVFKFAIPPRAIGGLARQFLAMTMIGQVSNLWPTDTSWSAAQPFFDDSVNGVRYTGEQHFYSSGCGPGQFTPDMSYCNERWQRTQYRALTYAKLDFAGPTRSTYATAATAQLAPVEATVPLTRFADRSWVTSEGALP